MTNTSSTPTFIHDLKGGDLIRVAGRGLVEVYDCYRANGLQWKLLYVIENHNVVSSLVNEFTKFERFN